VFGRLGVGRDVSDISLGQNSMDGRGQRCERTRSWIGTVCDHANYDDIRDDGACMGDALHDALDNSFHGFVLRSAVRILIA
jgi:hypothetical protein